jgi:acetoin utilization protein AcuB
MMLVQNRMTRDPVTVTPDDTLARALQLTRSNRVRHLPVVGGDHRLAGILSDRDIRLAMPSPLTVEDAERADFLERTPIAAVMTREVISIAPSEPIEEAARLMYSHRIGALPVVGDGRLVGIVTDTDILYAFVQVLGGMEPSSRVEIELTDKPGELARAVEVIGSELGVNIVSLVVSNTEERRSKRAVLHLATINPAHAVQALAAQGVKAAWPSLDHPEEEGADQA